MNDELEYFKRLNMVEILRAYYHMKFDRKGDEYVCLSPFTNESNASFFVKQCSDGHWLFKDFSSDYGGSIIDFILLKENFIEVSQAITHLRALLTEQETTGMSKQPPVETVEPKKDYHVHDIYNQIKDNEIDICRNYLSGRGISQEVIKQLIAEHVLLHNRYKEESYCSFAVYDADKVLRCIDNHMITGNKKFVLGKKHIFSLDWPALKGSDKVYICESIIDYLSIKTVEGVLATGFALLGNQLNSYDLSFLNNTVTLVSCFDNDGGGFGGYLDLTEKFVDKQILIYELGPDQKDINDRLLSEKKAQRANNLTAADKLALYKAFIRSDNRSHLAEEWGIDRSYLYKIVKECEQMLLNNFSERRVGRKSSYEMETKSEVRDRLIQLEEEKQQLEKEKEFYYAQGEFLKLRLKWSERELSELRGDIKDSNAPKRQIKKKRNKKR
jgi:DNA primase